MKKSVLTAFLLAFICTASIISAATSAEVTSVSFTTNTEDMNAANTAAGQVASDNTYYYALALIVVIIAVVLYVLLKKKNKKAIAKKKKK